MKLAPVVVRYFLPLQGIPIKLLDFESITGEASEIILFQPSGTTKDKKVVSFCGDNCNTNFGGVKRKGVKNVFSRLKKGFKLDVVKIGYRTHIVHNRQQTAVDGLPIEIKSLVVKIYKHFWIYTVRVTKLKEFL